MKLLKDPAWYVILGLGWATFSSGNLLAQQSDAADATGTEIANDRRQWERPLFLPDSDIPTGAVRRLGFEPGSTDGDFTIYSAGDDKVVRIWRVSESRGKYSIEPQDKIRWPRLKNDPSGLINAVARRDYDKHLKLMAFGGYGLPLRQAIRLINFGDREDPQTLVDEQSHNFQVFSLDFHPSRPLLAVCWNNGDESRIGIWKFGSNSQILARLDPRIKLAHRLRFNPDGTQLAVANRAGQVTTIGFNQTDLKFDQPIPPVETGALVQELAWTDNQTWLAASFNRGLIRGSSISGKLIGNTKSIRIRNSTPADINYMAAFPPNPPIGNPSFRIAAGTEVVVGDRLMNFDLDGLKYFNVAVPGVKLEEGFAYEIRPRSDRQVQLINLTWITASVTSVDHQLTAIGCTDPEQQKKFNQKPFTVALQSFNDQILPTLEQPDFDGAVTAVAISDDGAFLLASGTQQTGDSDVAGIEIRLWSLISGKLLARYPTAQQLETSTASSAISQIDFVRTKTGQNVIRFNRGPCNPNMNQGVQKSVSYKNAFGLTAPRGFINEPLKAPIFEKLYWTGTPEGQIVWRYPKAAEGIGPFSTTRATNAPVHPVLREMGAEICATSFRTRSGEAFIAIGYEHGILIWDALQVKSGGGLNGPDFGAAICRGFVGHEGNTTCLAVDNATSARLLISGSDDGMISGWSLDGLQAKASQRQELGVEFELQHNKTRLFVKQIDETAPGYLAGFSPGQEIVSVDIPLRSLNNPGYQKSSNPVTWKQLLAGAIPGERLIVEVQTETNASKLLLQTTQLHQPLWTLYPWNDGHNWAIWSPEGFFVAPAESAQSVGKHIGWQRNSPLSFNSAESNWDLYRKATLFNDLLESHNKQRFLDKIRGIDSPVDIFATRLSLEPVSPDERVPLKLKLKAVPAGQERITKLQLWCNSFLVYDEQDETELNQLTTADPLVIEVADKLLRSDENLITAVVESQIEGQVLYNEKTLTGLKKRSTPPSTQEAARPRLHFFGVGVTSLKHADDWNRSANKIKPLQFAANDVARLALAFADVADGHSRFQPGKFQILIDTASLQPPVSDWDRADQSRWEKMTAGKSHAPLSPTKEQILSALKKLTQEDPPAADDLLVIQFAGHGFDEGASDVPAGTIDEFFFVAQDTDAHFGHSITRTELESYLNQLPCKTLLLVDTCYAGSVLSPEKAHKNQLHGPQIMTSCTLSQLSHEKDHAGGKFGQGLFTAAVLEALTGNRLVNESGSTRRLRRREIAADDTDQQLSVEEIGVYVKRRVPELIKILNIEDKVQSPQIQTSRSFPAEKTLLKTLQTE